MLDGHRHGNVLSLDVDKTTRARSDTPERVRADDFTAAQP
jgi:hypothetical protein